jgi:HlyD family secretion protein
MRGLDSNLDMGASQLHPLDRGAAGRRRLPLTRVKAVGRKRLYLAGGLVVVLAAAGAAYWYSGTPPAPTYITQKVGRGPVIKIVTSTGTVNPTTTVQVGTYVSGVIQEISCDFNTQVKKGQLCAKIDPRPYRSIVDVNRAELATARAQLVKDRANLAYTKQTYERNAGLLKRGIVSQDTAESSKNAYDQAQAQIELDQAAIKQREASLETALVNLGYTDIVSPVDGTVISRNVTIGQTVAASFQTPTLFLIATDLTSMQVDTNISESDIGRVKLGDKATFTVEAFPNRAFEGEVTQVRQAPQTVQNVVTYNAVVSARNEALQLKPGMTATMRITTDKRDDALRVPESALRYVPGGQRGRSTGGALRDVTARATSDPTTGHVYVLADDKPKRVRVKTGVTDDNFVEVTGDDLAAGDQLIVGERSEGGGGQQNRQGQNVLRFAR